MNETTDTLRATVTPHCPDCLRAHPQGHPCPACDVCGKTFTLDNDVYVCAGRAGVKVSGLYHCPVCFQVCTYDELQAATKTSEVTK